MKGACTRWGTSTENHALHLILLRINGSGKPGRQFPGPHRSVNHKARYGSCDRRRTDYLNTTAVAALVAGMFTATREVARMVGENQFSILLQQGEMRHIHISLVADASMMAVIFEDHNRIGLIRHSAKKAADQLSELSQKVDISAPLADEISLPKFKEYALNLIDRIFEPQPE